MIKYDMKHSISSKCNDEVQHYKFNKNIDVSDKYRKGRLDSSTWLSDVTYYFLEKEKSIMKEYYDEIQKQRKRFSTLKEGEYKQGLGDELDLIEKIITDNFKIKSS